MPRQNRVTPSGELIACPGRGSLMGNRGILHEEGGRLRRSWHMKRWLICRLEFWGRRRKIMTPNRYTESSFLDEATAMAAGHWPCCECRRARYLAYRDAWAAGSRIRTGTGPIGAETINDRLHAERLAPDWSKRTFRRNLDDLPDGAYVVLDRQPDASFLIQRGELLAWSPDGYRERRP